MLNKCSGICDESTAKPIVKFFISYYLQILKKISVNSRRAQLGCL
nr:MAG TPA: hypothetical protein [Caudoviricetes sp.]